MIRVYVSLVSQGCYRYLLTDSIGTYIETTPGNRTNVANKSEILQRVIQCMNAI